MCDAQPAKTPETTLVCVAKLFCLLKRSAQMTLTASNSGQANFQTFRARLSTSCNKSHACSRSSPAPAVRRVRKGTVSYHLELVAALQYFINLSAMEHGVLILFVLDYSATFALWLRSS
eukprot:3462895-Pleurochrysis_carterae.AAC.4